MKENDWTDSICLKLQKFLSGLSLFADTFQKIPYSQEIDYYTPNGDKWTPNRMDPTVFETDLVIYEKDNDRVKPRVIVEAKIGSVTVFDLIK